MTLQRYSKRAAFHQVRDKILLMCISKLRAPHHKWEFLAAVTMITFVDWITYSPPLLHYMCANCQGKVASDAMNNPVCTAASSVGRAIRYDDEM